jgi:hypothetical protein
MSSKTNHNLDIYTYSFQDILELFHLHPEFNIEDLRKAKLVALKTHPDKSGLPPQYFLFYKKAFDIVLEYYNNSQKTNVPVPQLNPEYSTDQPLIKSVKNAISKTEDTKKFNDRFNKLYETNMKKEVDTEKYRWFKEENPVYDIKATTTTSASGIHGAIDNLKRTSSSLSIYKGVQELTLPTTATSFYEDDAENEGYVTCDPFSKLKFDDLRKVHKDQTVLSVSERDFNPSKTFGSTDEMRKARGNDTLTPLEKSQAEKILREKEEQKREMLVKRQHDANLQTMRFKEKNSVILGEFLRLGN